MSFDIIKSMSERERDIDVYKSMLDIDKKIGTLYENRERGKEVYSFGYDDNWIKGYPSRFFDPDLPIEEGRKFTPYDKRIFGLFDDSTPDRWGRKILQRYENIIAEEEKRQSKTLNELDYILYLCDVSRMGGLRFKYEGEEEFIGTECNIPKIEELGELENASFEYEKNDDKSGSKCIKQLVKASAQSLGGARPKVCVKDKDGTLWIAKFPSKKDKWNMEAWEYTVQKLAFMCGLNTTEIKIKNLSKRGSTFLSKRFDRAYSNKEMQRIHYASSMTMLGKTDGSGFKEEIGYLDIAEFIKMYGAETSKDLEELWNRVFFNYCISNTDDHLRNHGFLLTEKGWKLSPLFDVNPNPMGTYSALAIDENKDNELSLKTIIDTAYCYGLEERKAKENAERITQVVNDNWKRIAKSVGISQSEINKMGNAFRK